jgi:hypothetical protein
MRASDSSVGGDTDRVAKIQVGNRALNAAQGRLKPRKPEAGQIYERQQTRERIWADH